MAPSASSSSSSSKLQSDHSLADRRRSTVSKYLESDNHKSDFFHKLKDLRERERTVSDGTVKASPIAAGDDVDEKCSPEMAQNLFSAQYTPAAMAPAPRQQPMPPSDRPPPEQSRASHVSDHRSSALDALSGRRQPGRPSIGGLMVIDETNTPNMNESPSESEASPIFNLSPGTSTFPGFSSSPFRNVFVQSGSNAGNLSPGTNHCDPHSSDSPLAESVRTFLAAPRAKQEVELKAKFTYLAALSEENNQLRELLQRQVDMSPMVTKSGAIGGFSDEEDNGKDEIIQSLSLQLADQMDAHDKVIYELGLLRSHHATLQALASDYLDELEMLRHQVRDLQDQVITGQAETEEMRRRREEEEETRRHETKRVEMLRQALEDSKMAIKRLQDQSNQRRQSMADSRRTSVSSNGPERRPLHTLGLGLPARDGDSYTVPVTRRGSVSTDRRTSLLNAQIDFAGKARRRASMALAAHDADAPKPRPRSVIASVGLGFDIPDTVEYPNSPRRNSSGGLAVHIEAMSPRAGDNSPSISVEDRDKRKKEIASDIESLRAPSHLSTEVEARRLHTTSSLGINQVMIDMQDLARLKANSVELEELKTEMAMLKCRFAECEEARAATLDALNTLRQHMASDPIKSQSLTTLSISPDAKKVGRWGMPKMPALVARSPSGVPSSVNTPVVTPAMSVKSATTECSSATSSATTPVSSIFSWNRRTGSVASSITSISPSASPAMDNNHTTPCLNSSSSTFGKFSLSTIVGTTTSSSSQVAQSPRQQQPGSQTPPSLVHSVSSAETSPLASPRESSVATETSSWSPPLARMDPGMMGDQSQTPKVGSV